MPEADAVPSNLRIEVEECLEACLQLFFNLILTAFEHVHGDVSFDDHS